MSEGDGSGWRYCGCGERHWGLFGAAGLLLRSPAGSVLLQLRSARSHEGGTWGLPGGARDSHESVLEAAVREATEEMGLTHDVEPIGVLVDDHGDWSYTTVVAAIATEPDPVLNWESDAARWLTDDDIDTLPLHPGLARTWPVLRGSQATVSLVVDGANVMGARPDGWWRDRPAAAGRLRDRLAAVARAGIAAADLPKWAGTLTSYFPSVVLVLEGATRALPDDDTAVCTVRAVGSGDDAVVDVVAARSRRGPTYVVTADRELRGRCLDSGGYAVGPGWLWRLCDAQ